MSIFKTRPSDFSNESIDGSSYRVLKKSKFQQFSPSVLGLGETDQDSEQMGAICAIFDLEGFTNFCKQIDPHLSVPTFLSDYLKWIFEKIKAETISKEGTTGFAIWHDLPILVKFMGDGLLILWDTKTISMSRQRNIITSMRAITKAYVNEFFPVVRKKVSDAPPRLRCGIAKGNVYSVGNGNDFVGPCINLAARLQKMPEVTFAFASRGFLIEEWPENLKSTYVLKKVTIRGMSDGELIYLEKKEFDKVSESIKNLYQEP